MNNYRVYFRNIEVTARGLNEYSALKSTGLFKDGIQHLKNYTTMEKQPVCIYQVFMWDTKGLELVVIERI